MMLHFVIDTNVFISAHLLMASPSRMAFELALRSGVIVRSEETTAEIAEVFTRPKFDRYVSMQRRLAAMDAFEQRSVLVRDVVPIKACRDPKDDKFLSLAMAVNADCIISGDSDLLVLSPFKGIPVMTPSEFIQSGLVVAK